MCSSSNSMITPRCALYKFIFDSSIKTPDPFPKIGLLYVIWSPIKINIDLPEVNSEIKLEESVLIFLLDAKPITVTIKIGKPKLTNNNFLKFNFLFEIIFSYKRYSTKKPNAVLDKVNKIFIF